jgi:hypothetical protein
MREFNPFGIIIEALDPREGTLEFSLEQGNLFKDNIERVLIFRIRVKDMVFTLERSGRFFLRFIREGPQFEKRVTEVNIDPFREKGDLFIALTWSREGDAIYVSSSGDPNPIAGYSGG